MKYLQSARRLYPPTTTHLTPAQPVLTKLLTRVPNSDKLPLDSSHQVGQPTFFVKTRNLKIILRAIPPQTGGRKASTNSYQLRSNNVRSVRN